MDINFNEVKEQTGFTPLPVGFYTVCSDEAIIKETKNGGECVKVVFRVTEGEFTGRKLFHNFTIKNANAQAVTIGLSSLKQFIRCSNLKITQLKDVNDLVGGICQVSVKIQKSEEYGDQNRCSYFKERAKEEKKASAPF